jgi:hypothetical protein
MLTDREYLAGASLMKALTFISLNYDDQNHTTWVKLVSRDGERTAEKRVTLGELARLNILWLAGSRMRKCTSAIKLAQNVVDWSGTVAEG